MCLEQGNQHQSTTVVCAIAIFHPRLVGSYLGNLLAENALRSYEDGILLLVRLLVLWEKKQGNHGRNCCYVGFRRLFGVGLSVWCVL